MAMREFRISDALAGLHSWNVTQSGKLECRDCGALAKVDDGTYYLLYPADPALDCEVRAAARGEEESERLQALVKANFSGFSVIFPEGCHPEYVAAVLIALQQQASFRLPTQSG